MDHVQGYINGINKEYSVRIWHSIPSRIIMRKAYDWNVHYDMIVYLLQPILARIFTKKDFNRWKCDAIHLLENTLGDHDLNVLSLSLFSINFATLHREQCLSCSHCQIEYHSNNNMYLSECVLFTFLLLILVAIDYCYYCNKSKKNDSCARKGNTNTQI